MCTIKDAKGHNITTIPQADGLYHLATPTNEKKSKHANVAATKMSISEVHWRLGHISHTVIRHAISSGWITGIDLDMDLKPEFCEPCVKAKSIQQPFLKKSDTQAETFGEHVHWDLWGPVSVKSLSGNLYVAVCIDDHTCKTQQYFQPTKSQTFNSYKHDEAMI